ncbi:hypothetical protein Q5P01_025154 [Channa striata]|uniref:Uncharacterized protein n=1 Tax=Channa striata TaxID=64152 RepID=A0AA88IW74_CHASR|nr:hypothetical protein Q5P01_025154 [Channa striata]
MSISSGNSSTFSHSESFPKPYTQPTQLSFSVAHSLRFMQGPPTTACILLLVVNGAEWGVVRRTASETVCSSQKGKLLGILRTPSSDPDLVFGMLKCFLRRILG